MKRILSVILAVVFGMLVNSCKKHSGNPIDQLPPTSCAGRVF